MGMNGFFICFIWLPFYVFRSLCRFCWPGTRLGEPATDGPAKGGRNLSARNLAQQQEKQQLLARQNEQLELHVAERTRELHQQADQLRELDQAKSRFVTNITHEFRTPLSLILSPVEKLLQEKRYDAPLLTSVQRNAEQLLRLINQLLDLSKLEDTHVAVNLLQGEVVDFVQQIIEQFQRLAEQKGIHLSGVVGPFPPQAHLFDADKWEKILTNLLANAIKFTSTGGQVTLSLTPVWTGGGDGCSDSTGRLGHRDRA